LQRSCVVRIEGSGFKSSGQGAIAGLGFLDWLAKSPASDNSAAFSWWPSEQGNCGASRHATTAPDKFVGTESGGRKIESRSERSNLLLHSLDCVQPNTRGGKLVLHTQMCPLILAQVKSMTTCLRTSRLFVQERIGRNAVDEHQMSADKPLVSVIRASALLHARRSARIAGSELADNMRHCH